MKLSDQIRTNREWCPEAADALDARDEAIVRLIDIIIRATKMMPKGAFTLTMDETDVVLRAYDLAGRTPDDDDEDEDSA